MSVQDSFYALRKFSSSPLNSTAVYFRLPRSLPSPTTGNDWSADLTRSDSPRVKRIKPAEDPPILVSPTRISKVFIQTPPDHYSTLRLSTQHAPKQLSPICRVYLAALAYEISRDEQNPFTTCGPSDINRASVSKGYAALRKVAQTGRIDMLSKLEKGIDFQTGMFYFTPVARKSAPKGEVIDALTDDLAPFFTGKYLLNLELVSTQWYPKDDECEMEDGLLRTNVEPEWPKWIPPNHFAPDSQEYIDIVKGLYSSDAHPVALAFRYPGHNESDLYAIRDLHLRSHCPALANVEIGYMYTDSEEGSDHAVNSRWARLTGLC